jgi:glutamate/tyrosine decarboxylase-like PLP-dependent enzyme
MIDIINSLEKESRLLEQTEEQRKNITDKIFNYSNDFLNNIYKAKAFEIDKSSVNDISSYPVSDSKLEIDKILSIIKNSVDTPGLNPASGGHLGYIPGGGIFSSSVSDYLTDITNRYAGIYFASPGAVKMENFLIQWFCSLFGFPETAYGNLTSGGSIANLIGIVTARDKYEINSANILRSCIYLTKYAHHSVSKAIRISGLKECIIREIPVDDKFRMDADMLEKIISEDTAKGLNPFLIIASVGTTDTGSVDPVNNIGDIASVNNLWLHLDAAYGGFFILTESGKKIIKGMEKADSIVIDPHKGLFLPYGSGAVIVKDADALMRSHFYSANYMQDTASANEERSPAEFSPELTKHFKGLRLWLPLMLLGLKPFKAALEEKILLARYFYEELQKDKNFELGPYPDLSVTYFRYIPAAGNVNEFNKKLIQEIQNDGRIFLSSTMLNDNFYIRLAVLSFRTHLDTIDLTLKIIYEKINLLLT